MGKLLLAMLPVLFGLSACGNFEDTPLQKAKREYERKGDGVVIKVCRDGARILRYKDGTHRVCTVAPFWGRSCDDVSGPDVCE